MGSTPLLIALPDGLSVSGVTTWAVRLANALARQGRAVGLIVHDEPEGTARLEAAIERGVEIYEAPAAGLEPTIRFYKAAADDLADRHGGPVVLSPNLRGDCYGAAAALVGETEIRLVGWQHSDIEYDRRVLAHFAPVIERFVGVSDVITSKLRGVLGDRAGDVVGIPYGVETPEAPAARAPLEGRPLRLIYTGRMEHRQKRILSMVSLSDALTQRGIEHELTLLGDGPAASEIDAACATRPSLKRLDPVAPGDVAALLDESDLFVLGSRFEGLSVSMLEAMARGCTPIVAKVDSGAEQAITDGQNGLIADVSPDADEAAVGAALADAVERALAANLDVMSMDAWMTATESYSVERHAEKAAAVIDQIAFASPREWPAGRLLAFDTAGGSVPPEGPALLRALLASLHGRRIAVHGAGAHTRMLWPVFEASGVEVVAFCDDDLAAQGTMLHGRPVVAPSRVGECGATDVVISSWMHQDAVWARRAMYGDVGVHRIYGAEAPGRAAAQR